MLSLSNPPRLCLSVLFFLLHLSPVLSMSCEEAPFVPGHDLLENGFDAVTLKTRANVFDLTTIVADNCDLVVNPLQDNMLQKVHPAVQWTSFSPHNMEHSHTEHTSVSSLISQYSDEGSNSWQSGFSPFPQDLDIVGTGSDVYTFAADLSQEENHFFSCHRVSRTHYRHELYIQPPLNSQFIAAMASLPESFSIDTKADYRQFIETYGTHSRDFVDLGGQLNEVTAASVCTTVLNGLSPQQVHFCSKLGFCLGLGKSTPDNIEACNNVLQSQVSTLLNRYTEVIGGEGWSGEFSHVQEDFEGYTNWLETLVASPDVVSYFLSPLYRLATNVEQQTALRAAIEDYLTENAISPLTQAGDGGLNNCCPQQQAPLGHVEVTITRGWLEQGKPETYVVLTFNDETHSTHVIKLKDPVWNAIFDLGTVDTHQTFTVQLWKKNNGPDDILVSCTFDVHQGTHMETCSSEKGKVYFEYTLTCDDGLTGDKCNESNPTPN